MCNLIVRNPTLKEGKNNMVVLVPCHNGSVSLQLLPVVWIFSWCVGVIHYNKWVLSEGQRSLQGLVSHELTAYLSGFKLFLTQWIIAILLKVYEPDNLESHNSLKLSIRNIRGLSWNFVECETLLIVCYWHAAYTFYSKYSFHSFRNVKHLYA